MAQKGQSTVASSATQYVNKKTHVHFMVHANLIYRQLSDNEFNKFLRVEAEIKDVKKSQACPSSSADSVQCCHGSIDIHVSSSIY